MTLQTDAANGALGKEITFSSTSLDQNVREILLQEDALALLRQVGLHRTLDDFCLSIRIGGEIDDAAARCTLGDVIQLVAGHGGYVESLDEVIALFAVAVNTVIDGALVVLLEYLYMEDILTDEYLVCYLGDFKLTILIEDDDVIEVGAVASNSSFFNPVPTNPS